MLLCTGKDGVVQAKEKGTAFGRFFTIALRRGGREAHNLQKCIESISKQIESCKFFTKEELKDHAGKLENLVNTLNSLIDKYNSSPKHKKQPIQKLDLIFKKSTLAEDTSNPGAIGSPSGVTTPDHPKRLIQVHHQPNIHGKQGLSRTVLRLQTLRSLVVEKKSNHNPHSIYL